MSRQFIPANGWCYFHWDVAETKVAIYDLALWEVREDGLVVGLISVEIAKTESNIACLTTPPPVGGRYFLKGSAADPRQWPNPPEVLKPYRTDRS